MGNNPTKGTERLKQFTRWMEREDIIQRAIRIFWRLFNICVLLFAPLFLTQYSIDMLSVDVSIPQMKNYVLAYENNTPANAELTIEIEPTISISSLEELSSLLQIPRETLKFDAFVTNHLQYEYIYQGSTVDKESVSINCESSKGAIIDYGKTELIRFGSALETIREDFGGCNWKVTSATKFFILDNENQYVELTGALGIQVVPNIASRFLMFSVILFVWAPFIYLLRRMAQFVGRGRYWWEQ